MSRLLSRRKMMLGVGGAVAVSPLALAGSAAADSTGPLVVLTTPVRLYDSRTDAVPLGGAKLASGNSVIVTAGGFGAERFPRRRLPQRHRHPDGRLRVLARDGSDLSGERPVPKTSNINWFATNQTLGESRTDDGRRRERDRGVLRRRRQDARRRRHHGVHPVRRVTRRRVRSTAGRARDAM